MCKSTRITVKMSENKNNILFVVPYFKPSKVFYKGFEV